MQPKNKKRNTKISAGSRATAPPPRSRKTSIWIFTALAGIALGCLLFFLAPTQQKTKLPPAAQQSTQPNSPLVAAHHVGAKKCAECHADQYEAWRGSDHDLAMQKANASTVLGDFNNAHFKGDGMDVGFFQRDGKYFIRAEGPDGKTGEFEAKFTFGVTPLQQYLIALPQGKLQAFTVAWDTRPKEKGGQRWFHLYPGKKFRHDDELHWTGVQQNWNFMCADCHSTNLQKNFDPLNQRFSTTWSEINVSCEACHGPGSAHVAWADSGAKNSLAGKGLTVNLDERHGVVWNHDATSGNSVRSRPRTSGREIEVCAQCHSFRAQIAEGYHAGLPFLDHYRPSLPAAPEYFADGQQRSEVFTWASFLQSRMHAKGVTCSDCHNPHTTKLRANGNMVCAQCHAAAKYDSAEHHFHPLASKGAQCISCHMPERYYMVIDGRHDHSLRVPRPDITVLRGAENAPNACNNCHSEKSAKWAADAVAKWYGPNRRHEQHFGATLAATNHINQDDIKALSSLVDNTATSPIVRATALQTLSALPGPAAIQTTSSHTQDTNDLIRLAASEAAIILPPAERAAALLPLLHDERLAIRISAVNGLLDFPRTAFNSEQLAALDIGVAEYRKVQAYNADRAEGQTNLGQLEARLGNADAATAAFEAAIRINPAFSPAYINLADLKARQGREDEAEKTLRRAIEIEPKDAALHHALGLSLIRSKRLKDALSELKQAATLRPEDARYAYVYAIALHETGNAKKAITVLKQAAKLHPTDRDILNALVEYATTSGDNATASEATTMLEALQS